MSGRHSPVCACQGCSRRGGKYRGSPGSGHTPSRSPLGAAPGAAPDPTAANKTKGRNRSGHWATPALAGRGDGSGGAHLLAHGLGVGDGGAEEAIPLQAPIEPGPVVVPVAGMGQAPGDEGVELPVRGVARLAWEDGGGEVGEQTSSHSQFWGASTYLRHRSRPPAAPRSCCGRFSSRGVCTAACAWSCRLTAAPQCWAGRANRNRGPRGCVSSGLRPGHSCPANNKPAVAIGGAGDAKGHRLPQEAWSSLQRRLAEVRSQQLRQPHLWES